jgi:hypothetical protein
MKRRTFLATAAGVSALGLAGCTGAGKVVTQVSRDITVQPRSGWSEEIPDVSDPGGGMEFIARSDRRFSVYVFTEEADFLAYRSYVQDGESDRTPRGHPDFSKRATYDEERDLFEAMTDNEGAREPIDATGPYWFVLDHSHYGIPSTMSEEAEPISVFLDLQVVRKNSPF